MSDVYYPQPLVTVPPQPASYSLMFSGNTWQILPADYFDVNVIVPPEFPPTIIPIPPDQRYIAPAVHFDGNTILAVQNLYPTVEIPTKVSFSVWCKSDWTGGQTVFAVNPSGINTPFLRTIPPCLFVVADDAQYDGSGNLVTPMKLYYSIDGVYWPTASFPSFSKAQSPNLQYGNGMWICVFNYVYGKDSSGDDLVKNVCFSSVDGKTWATDMVADENVSTIINTSFDPVANTWTLTNGSKTKVLPIPNPPQSLFADVNIIFPQGDPNNQFPGNNAPNLRNALPGAFTGVRFNMNSSTPYTVDLTVNTITQAVVDSGPAWPAVNWTTALPGPTGSFGGNTRTLSYGAPTGNTIGQTGFLIADYSGLTISQPVRDWPLFPPNRIGWVHIMGSINLGTGVALLYINEQFCGTVNVNLRGGDPRNKTIFIGGDLFGNNFIGDMADFYLYLGLDFGSLRESGGGSGFIPIHVRRWFINDFGGPVNPISSAGPLVQMKELIGLPISPTILLTGAAETTTDPKTGAPLGFLANTYGLTVNQAQVVQGTLTDADSSPSDIMPSPSTVPL